MSGFFSLNTFMVKQLLYTCSFFILLLVGTSFKKDSNSSLYEDFYLQNLETFEVSQNKLLWYIQSNDINNVYILKNIKQKLDSVRIELKAIDFWLRYLEPISYKLINGPLPVEWETEVFEKFEKPYKRLGAGITLAQLHLDEDSISKTKLVELVRTSERTIKTFYQDSIIYNLKKPDHFFFCNRLFLLNLAAIYSTGFECPNTQQIIPELKSMVSNVRNIYTVFNRSFNNTRLTDDYELKYNQLIQFLNTQSNNYENFNHFEFIRNYINPLFVINQSLILKYHLKSNNNQDYSLNSKATSIFSKSLYHSQNTKGVYSRISDQNVLSQVEALGKLFFYDPILSGNNMRSCASCHKPNEFYTDTNFQTSLHYDRVQRLTRNTPTLINSNFNHLLMLDGKHITLQNQTKDVMTNKNEMSSTEKELLEKILSCSDYKKALKKLLKYTPQEPEISIEHVSSAITYYYSKFSKHSSRFDFAMNLQKELSRNEEQGFNLFMSKAQCGTCHFVPQFNGVKPPYVGSEFEVLGVPKDTLYKEPSEDVGRYEVNPTNETHRAFRTGTIRNSSKTKPYMHNGIFKDLNQVIEFYNGGGGSGRGLNVSNQTLSGDSLHLTNTEKLNLIAFIQSLDEDVPSESPPLELPKSSIKSLNKRKISGEY